ncbi:TonB-dependent Receptor [Croceitalea dokdonensis DOKDO 023]|uniref:TonB-dependent Receptor n=1 Tax=Croceitalea dokdonensis DOKDO 023 TaxID=1300341 RepID=A0A0P7AE92_9FLAO|nr:TonB-dependent receptor [Croceitalea dokdonensis]KPM31529.1 TonB-dependent Receptor [Croceitalea dokdonensis DOKDO 023]
MTLSFKPSLSNLLYHLQLLVVIVSFFNPVYGHAMDLPPPTPYLRSQEFTISGYVTENGSAELLLGVSVYVQELKLGTVSNDYGFYSLTLPAGRHTLIISYIGYKTQKLMVELSGDISQDIVLEPTTEQLDEVTVTSGSRQQESKITQMSTMKMDPEIVENVPALLGEKDVLKTLQLLPGISGGTEGSAGFFVRGGTPDQNLIILDDAVVYNSNHLFGFFSVFNGDAIKSVEAFKGGFPARFGGRLSSVIKIDMKDGNKEKITGKANIGLISSSFILEGPINQGKTSFVLSGRRTYADILAQPFLPDDVNAGYFFADLNVKVHHIFNDKNRLYWSTYYGQDKFYSNEEFSDGDTFDAKVGWGNITSTLRWNHKFNNKFFANSSLIFSNYNFRVSLDDRFDDDISIFKSSSGINDYSVKTDFNYYPNPNHSIRFGLLGTLHNFNPQRLLIEDPFIDNQDTTQELNSFEGAAYIEDDWRVTEKFRVSAGFRLSYFKQNRTTYLNPEPRLGLSWNVHPDLAIKASYANMNQYVHLLSSSGIGLPTDLWVSATDNVKPQRANQFAFGIAKDFTDNQYSLSLEGYYKTMDDIIEYREGASFLVFDDLESAKEVAWEDNITAGRGWSYGAELLLRKKQGPFTGWLGYTLSWSQRQFDELNLGKRFNARYDRRHDISLVGIYKPSKKVTLSANWVYSSGINFTLPTVSRLPTQTNLPINDFFNDFLFDFNTDFSNQRNNFRGEATHRFDLGVQFHKQKKWGQRTWGISIYNAYARRNPFFYFTESNNIDLDNDESPDINRQELNRVAFLVFVPSINYTFKFN